MEEIEEKKELLERHEVRTMAKDIARLREAEAQKEKEKISKFKSEKESKIERERMERIKKEAEAKERSLEEARKKAEGQEKKGELEDEKVVQKIRKQALEEAIKRERIDERRSSLPLPPSVFGKLAIRLVVFLITLFFIFSIYWLVWGKKSSGSFSFGVLRRIPEAIKSFSFPEISWLFGGGGEEPEPQPQPVPQPTPQPQPQPQPTPTSTPQPQPQPQPQPIPQPTPTSTPIVSFNLIKFDALRTLEVAGDSEIITSLPKILDESSSVEKFTQLIIKNTTQGKTLGLKEFFGAFGVSVPGNFYGKTDNNFTLFTYSSPGRAGRLGFIVKITEMDGFNNLMLGWEKTMEQDTDKLFRAIGKLSPSLETGFQSAHYKGNLFRYLSIPSWKQGFGVCWSIAGDYLIFTDSGDITMKTMERMAK